MKKNSTHFTVILDRTGSMEAIRDDTIGGFNAYLKKQKEQPGTGTLTLVQFDTQDPYEVIHRFRPIQEVPELTRETYVPRACTPLLDALGRGINDLERSLADLGEEKRPSRVIMVVVTDGQENSSHEFRKHQIEKMIRDKTERNSWEFVYLSADLAAIGDALEYGFRPGAVLLYDRSTAGVRGAWEALSEQVCDLRAGRTSKIHFEPGDRKQSDDPLDPGVLKSSDNAKAKPDRGD